MLNRMQRFTADVWGGVCVTLVCLAVPVPVVIAMAQGRGIGDLPAIWWLAAYAGFAVAFLVSMWLVDLAPRRVVAAALVAQTVLAQVLVLSAPRTGWTPILLVLGVAVSAYRVPLRVSAAVIAANTVVIALASARIAETSLEVGMVAVLYLMLQAASVMSVHAHLSDIRSRRRLAEAHVQLRAASALQAEASRTDERLRIARELHDAVGHQLTVLSLELEIASHRADPGAAEPIARAKEVTGQLLADVRSTVGEMRRSGPPLRETLASVVADLPEPVVHLRIDDAVDADPEVARALVRCVQEVVTNAIRHARAEHLWIGIGAEGDRIVFEAHDDGPGDPGFAPGNGLRGMAERIEALGGSVGFSGAAGFRVRAAVPR
ncbi:hypothetical protein GCM10009853_027740 [Glycomyces scopariae]